MLYCHDLSFLLDKCGSQKQVMSPLLMTNRICRTPCKVVSLPLSLEQLWCGDKSKMFAKFHVLLLLYSLSVSLIFPLVLFYAFLYMLFACLPRLSPTLHHLNIMNCRPTHCKGRASGTSVFGPGDISRPANGEHRGISVADSGF